MTGDRLRTYQHAVPESAIELVAKQVLGLRLFDWSKAESGRMCFNFERQRQQLDSAVSVIQEQIDELDLDEFDVPEDNEGKPLYRRIDYKRMRQAELHSMMANNIASLDKLTTIYLKLTAGGLGAMLSGMKQSAMLQQQEKESQGERNVTPRRRYGAGLAQVESD